jgi:cytochrome c6
MAGSKKNRAAATAEALFILAALTLAIGLGVVGFFLGRDTAPKHTTTSATPTLTTSTPTTTAATTTTAPTSTLSATAALGKQVFMANGCASCHTLKDANATGKVGPDLDQLKPTAAAVAKQVTNGGTVMPAFKGTLSAAQIAAVAAYVSQVAGT